MQMGVIPNKAGNLGNTYFFFLFLLLLKIYLNSSFRNCFYITFYSHMVFKNSIPTLNHQQNLTHMTCFCYY